MITKNKPRSRRNLLEGPFTAIARAQSKHWGIVMKSSGSAICTDGESITFPWNSDEIDSIPWDVLNGYLDHEIGHVAEERRHREAGRVTPLELLRKSRNGTKSMLLNVFEDIRVEIHRGHEYPGVASNLNAANVYSVAKFRAKFEGHEQDTSHFWHTLGCGIILQARGHSVAWMPEPFAPFMAIVASEIRASRAALWGQDSWELACRVYEKVRELAEELIKQREKDSEPAPGSPATEDGTQGEAQGSLQDDAEAGSGQQQGGSPDASEGEPGESDQVGGGSGDPGDSGDSIADGAFTEAGSEHIMDEVGKDIERASKKQATDLGGYVPDPRALALDDWRVPPTRDQASYNAIRVQVAQQVSALRAKLIRVVRTRTEARTEYDRDQGQLDTSSLHQLRLGSKRVFSNRIQGDDLDTAVSVLVDLSGSMGNSRFGPEESAGRRRGQPGTRAYWARLTVVALAEAFEALNIPFEIIGFHNQSRTSKGAYCSGYGEGGPFVRREPLIFEVFKSFGESHRKVRTRLCGITGSGNNSDGEAVLAVAKRLAQRPEARKMMFVVSDGKPACGGSREKLYAHLKKVVLEVRASGIQIMGIGVANNSVSQFYGEEHSINVAQIDSMAVVIFKLVRSTLISGLRRVA